MINPLEDISRVTFLPSYFGVVGQLLSLLDTDRTNLAEIVRLVESDQALALRTLMVVNSRYYGLPRQVGRIDEAVIYLGLNELRNMAMAVAMNDITGGVREGEWRHNLAVAHLADRLYVVRQHPENPDAQKWVFASGLLHDIGRLFLSRSYMVVYGRILSTTKDRVELLEAERKAFGRDHAAIGGLMLRQWRLPEPIVEAVANHHDPQGNPLAETVQLADAAAHLLEQPRDQVADQLEALTGMGWSELSQIVQKAMDKSSIFNQ